MASSTSIWQEKIYHALTGIDDFLEAIVEKLEVLDDINDKLDLLQNLETLVNIANDLKDLSISMDATLTSIDGTLDDIEARQLLMKNAIDSINLKIDAANQYLSDIKDNTAVIIAPINAIKLNTDTLVVNSGEVKTDVHVISEYIDDIANSTGASAAFDEAIATNTLNTYNKVVTIASDTTDMRTKITTIVDLLQQINNKM